MNLFNLTTILISFCFILSCTDKKEKLGEEIIAKIETFKKQNGHLPNKLDDIEVIEKEEGPIYYLKQSDTTYKVYFGGVLGESIVYNFETKQWESDHQ
jgi:hypothetical protein